MQHTTRPRYRTLQQFSSDRLHAALSLHNDRKTQSATITAPRQSEDERYELKNDPYTLHSRTINMYVTNCTNCIHYVFLPYDSVFHTYTKNLYKFLSCMVHTYTHPISGGKILLTVKLKTYGCLLLHPIHHTLTNIYPFITLRRVTVSVHQLCVASVNFPAMGKSAQLDCIG